MKVDLKAMTLEELWELFPIVLAEHSPMWAEWAREEIDFLSGLLSPCSPVINHIGSTAITNIKAKPIVDILVEVADNVDWRQIKEVMETHGYICMSESANRISFNKGYTPAGYAEKVFHIHFHRIGDNDEILFRDYLSLHPDAAGAYERLKVSLLPKYKNDRDGYTAAKSAFISKILTQAK
ncbi:MAG: GrpB family protein [Muribaculaceae bacterium]|nr:GrpB family protein [Muribaculaceae bacterium]